MKYLLLVIILSFSIFANSTDKEQFLFTGENLEQSFSLDTEVTKIVYENRVVLSTCYRNEVRRRCRRVCNSQGYCRRVCRNVIVRRPYRCYVTKQVPVRVFDYTNISNLLFKFNSEATDIYSETFKLSQTGNKLKVKVKGSGNHLIRMKKVSERVSHDRDIRTTDITYSVNFENVSLITNVLRNGINNVKIRNNILSFNVGSGFNLEDFDINLKLYKYRRIGKDILLSNRSVNLVSELDDNGYLTNIKIDLRKLGVNLPRKKRVILDIKYNIGTHDAINFEDLRLSAKANWIFK